jgi:hypothetical protein
VPERGAETAADEYDQETHVISSVDGATKKPALRRVTDGLPPLVER